MMKSKHMEDTGGHMEHNSWPTIKPKKTDGYKPERLPRALKLIEGGQTKMKFNGEYDKLEPLGSPQIQVKNAFNRIGCLYLPVDDSEAICKWYEMWFNSPSTREEGLFWETTQEKGLTCNFFTDGWIPGETYEMFAVRFETDALDELYERLSMANVKLEPIRNEENGLSFVYTDPQGNKFQVWQPKETIAQPLQDNVPALKRVAALFFPASDPEASRKWYTDFLGVDVTKSGQPVTRTGQELYFYRSLQQGRTLNFYTGTGDIQNMSIAMLNVFDIDRLHNQLISNDQKIEGFLDREGCGIQFQLCDPDGNKLDIWDSQTMVRRNSEKADSPNWKDRFIFENSCFWVDIDSFFAKIINDEPGARHKRVQITEHALLRESDPEGLNALVTELHNFNNRFPDFEFEMFGQHYKGWEFEIVYRER